MKSILCFLNITHDYKHLYLGINNQMEVWQRTCWDCQKQQTVRKPYDNEEGIGGMRATIGRD